MNWKYKILTLCSLGLGILASAQEHPVLQLTTQGVEMMRASRGQVEMFDRSVDALLSDADEALSRELCVPEPRDGGGGYSHEMHKLNYYDMYECGIAYQLTGDRRYAAKVQEILYAYADMYPHLGYHPLQLSPVPGRIFWQTLNESVWMVHTSIAYDCIWDTLSQQERDYLEQTLFRPYAEFLMNGTEDNRANYGTFNKLNNHATWATSAVGMIAIVMGDEELLNKALYGSQMDGEAGFLRQMDVLFSPDGYFTEGAYYQRYAIWPFVTFAQCLDHYKPSLDIFNYRDGILAKALNALLNMAYDGRFFMFNDALDKGYDAQELIAAVDILYHSDPSNKSILSIADKYQHKVLVSDAGYAVAAALQRGEERPYEYHSMVLRDGQYGTEGTLSIVRSPNSDAALTLKATSHGLSHGHFDRLTYAYYDNGNEIVTDYGAARFVNIEAKYEGHYTHENSSWAKSTIAHNTVVVDCESQFGGSLKEASKVASRPYCNAFSDSLSFVSSREDHAYEGVGLERYMALADVQWLEYPVILDIFRLRSSEVHSTYDYPLHYNGHMISLSVPYTRSLDCMTPLGGSGGYQHLWTEAAAQGGEGSTSYTWLCGDRMYSSTTETTPETQVYLARLGANDPDFNLRSEPMLMLRVRDRSDYSFVSCLETHGRYDMQVEQSANLVHSCTGVQTLVDCSDAIIARYSFIGGHSLTLCVWTSDPTADAVHSVDVPGEGTISWTGVSHLIIE